MITPGPALATAAPASPPIGACDELVGGADGEVAEPARPVPHDLDAVLHGQVRRRVDRVHRVVHRPREGVDVLAVDGRDERAVEPLDDFVGQEVAAAFEVLDLIGLRRVRRFGGDQVPEDAGRLADVFSHGREVLVELLLPRDQPEPRHVALPFCGTLFLDTGVEVYGHFTGGHPSDAVTLRIGRAIVPRGPGLGYDRPAVPLMSHILIVEDDRDIADLLERYLMRAGHLTDALGDGRDALAFVRQRVPDLVVLDLMLPGVDGLEVCRTLRRTPETRALPIIMLTARTEEADRIAGLELGADDYVTKPFSPSELVARVGALLRRAQRWAESGSSVLSYGPIELDRERHLVTDRGSPVRLTAKEFLLLEYLMQHRGRVLSRDLLLTDVWGYRYTGGTRTVDVHVRRLREKLPVLGDGIETVKQFGYRLADRRRSEGP
jgi:DNA-binding response OmpR family regulator